MDEATTATATTATTSVDHHHQHQRLSIALVSDFVYPSYGGVESHIYNIAQCLIRRGHKVIIVTHAYNDDPSSPRSGVRHVTSGLKIYYVPYLVMHAQAAFPTIFTLFPVFRSIWIREQVDIVHGHQAFSPFCHEAILHARTMGLKACFTDHSLFGFADASSILTNKLLKFTLSDVDHVICVSNTSKENTVLRAALNPYQVSAIPNAIVGAQFQPDPNAADPNYITIVVLSRLVYRKGIDLLIAVIPGICQRFPRVRFLIGGDGPKHIELEQMREKYVLQDRVELIGGVQAADIRSVLLRGDIFLNTSLTEAFCIAIVEAACCGLLVVTTKVGGIPEVLPHNMVNFAEPEKDDIERALAKTIGIAQERHKHPDLEPWTMHNQVRQFYSWTDVAERTERVYRKVMNMPSPPLIERLRRYYSCGMVAGKLFCMVVALDYLLMILLELIWPAAMIERAPTFPTAKLCALVEKEVANVASQDDATDSVDASA
ncbi:GlcNAc transferase [Ramicandelaber brevisporus]|nr:GlcNAc transferase [Ramicandelaber brevisporus]